MIKVYLGIGSNLGDSISTISTAYDKISSIIGKITCKSSLYETVPVRLENSAEQPNYYNAVIEILTDLEPENLLDKIHSIEKSLGRDRSKEARWGARTIDIDILYYGDTSYKSSRLEIPHPEINNRDFVTVPLEEIKSGINKESKMIIRKL